LPRMGVVAGKAAYTYESCTGFGLKKLKITRRKRGDDSRFQEKKGCIRSNYCSSCQPRTSGS
jgi:hypothetical protein